jgi:hypothetical protein
MTIALWLLAALGPAFASQTTNPPDGVVDYPDGYRSWVHVKSSLISPGHKNYPATGGFHHIYANPQAAIGYRTREFADGSTIVFDWLEMRDSEGSYEEGARRQVDVMVKDSKRFAKTGGWGFQRFVKDSKTERAAAPSPQQCFDCHQKLKKDGLVLSTYRP